MIINDKRALAYTTRISWVRPIDGADNIELVGIGGWTCIAKIGEFCEGDICVYFEIDSKLPSDKEWCAFMESKKFKVKTMKLSRFGVVSQGLALPVNVFDIEIPKEENIDLTEKLGVTYADAEDNQRKAPSADKYKKMAQRRPKLFRNPIVRWFMRREWGRKLMFFFFGKKRDKNTAFPTHFPHIKKTDQERVENMIWVLNDKTPYIKTQKCDGSSGTYILERKGRKFEFYVCSRNVRQLRPDQKCFYEENYYWEVAQKYKIEEALMDIMKLRPDWKYCCLQGEVCAPGIQKNPHGLTETHFFAFHFTDSENGRWDIRKVKKLFEKYNIPTVPIVDENYIMPNDFEELKLDAEYYYSPECCEGKPKQLAEGWVYYKTTDPNFSFKNVSRKYLLKNS